MKDKRQRQAMSWPFGTPLADPSLYAYLLNAAAAASSMPPHSIYHPFQNYAIGPFSGYLPTALPSPAGSPIAHPAHRFLYGGAHHTDALPGVMKGFVVGQGNALPFAAADMLVAGGSVGAKSYLLANGLSSFDQRSGHIGADPSAPPGQLAAAAVVASGFPDLRTASAAPPSPSQLTASKIGYPSSARELFKPYKTTTVERR